LASIRFTDAAGTAVVSNGLDVIARGVGSRFAGWTPFAKPIGAVATALGTGARSMFRFRTDFGASFEIRDIDTVRLPEVLRLMAHLESGGTCAVFTDDVLGRSYASCCLAPEASTSLTQANATDLTYTLGLTLINLGGTAMLCDYSPVLGQSEALFRWAVADGVSGGTFARTGTASFVTDNA
jgi:hypothetical protein